VRTAASEAPPEVRAEAQAEVRDIDRQVNTNQRVYQAAANDVNVAEAEVESGGAFEVVRPPVQERILRA
jgi:hypothetical protein